LAHLLNHAITACNHASTMLDIQLGAWLKQGIDWLLGTYQSDRPLAPVNIIEKPVKLLVSLNCRLSAESCPACCSQLKFIYV
jgi:hypothetical protein